MSHNIALPTDSVHPITNLVIRDRFGSEVAVGFGPEQIGIRTPGAHDVVAVAGEDLYALRELLNELPEEAFVRPAEPVDPDAVEAAFGAVGLDGSSVWFTTGPEALVV